MADLLALPLDQARERIEQATAVGETDVSFAAGCHVSEPGTDGFAAALELAARSEIVLATVGDRWKLSPARQPVCGSRCRPS